MARSTTSVIPQPLLFVGGFIVVVLVWAKHILQGYRKPTDFAPADEKRSSEHAANIVAEYTYHLESYCETAWRGQAVLELGPGGTLATGIYILLNGADTYSALDAFPLAATVNEDFYREIAGDRPELLQAVTARDKAPFRYLVDPSFKVDEAIGAERFSRIVSCAAFEHFDDPADTIKRMTRIAQPGAAACIRVDMATHSQILRHRDPNNIYRYPDWLYWLLPFRGKPNRLRPADYARLFEKNGWGEIKIIPAEVVDSDYLERTNLDRKFCEPEAQMNILSVIILARYTQPAQPSVT